MLTEPMPLCSGDAPTPSSVALAEALAIAAVAARPQLAEPEVRAERQERLTRKPLPLELLLSAERAAIIPVLTEAMRQAPAGLTLSSSGRTRLAGVLPQQAAQALAERTVAAAQALAVLVLATAAMSYSASLHQTLPTALAGLDKSAAQEIAPESVAMELQTRSR